MARIKNHTYKYIPGDHLIICDRTGRVIRKSEAVVEPVTGYIVHRSVVDKRNPQEYLRARQDRQVPAGSIRTEPTDTEVSVCTAIYDEGVYEAWVYYPCVF